MLNTPKIVYSCDHNIIDLLKNVVSEQHAKTTGVYDLICDDGFVITTIVALYQTSGDTTKSYYEDVNFIKNPDNTSITWITPSSVPSPGEIYTIEYLKTKLNSTQFEPEDCPRCAATGWYVGLFEENGTVAKKITGITKLVQGYIKILLTTKAGNYGSTLKDISGTEVYDSQALSSMIVATVLECETNFRALQLTDINAGVLMSNAEKLKSATVSSVEFDSSVGAVYLSIILLSEDNTQSVLNLMI
jgi:hypothetical protein